jgi:hypothetical protein
MSLCWYCCVFWGRVLCDELITRPEESYRLWCVVVCDLETLRVGSPCLLGAVAPKTNQQSLLSWWIPTIFTYNINHSTFKTDIGYVFSVAELRFYIKFKYTLVLKLCLSPVAIIPPRAHKIVIFTSILLGHINEAWGLWRSHVFSGKVALTEPWKV